MAVPRVFISSTYYDLQHVRASLELFVETLGYQAILFERGDVPYSSTDTLSGDCASEASECDIYVLLIGGRYGSPADRLESADRHDYYTSVTKKEYLSALSRAVPIYILVQSNVWAEYHTYKKNKANLTIEYASVDNVNVYLFMDEILAQPRNNPVHHFEKATDIENWLRLQWAGKFRNYLAQESDNRTLASLTAGLDKLSNVADTIRVYSEELMKHVSKEDAKEIIETENTRLQERQSITELSEQRLLRHMVELGASATSLADVINSSRTFAHCVDSLVTFPQFRQVAAEANPFDIVMEILTLRRRYRSGQTSMFGEKIAVNDAIRQLQLALVRSLKKEAKRAADSAASDKSR